jgi:hypothetical protein
MQVCDKIAYPTHKQAQDAIVGSNKRNKVSLYSYKCKECKQFHLATNGKKKWIKNLRDKQIHLTHIKIHTPTPKKIKNKLQHKQKNLELATEKLLSNEMVTKLKLLIEPENVTLNRTTPYTQISGNC